MLSIVRTLVLIAAGTTLQAGQEPSPSRPHAEPSAETSGINDPQPQPAVQAPSGSCPSSDPFCAKLNESKANEHAHDQLQAGLEARLAALPKCSGGVYDEIAKVRGAAAKAHESYREYLKAWRQLADKDTALFARLTESRTGLRGEIERRIAELNQELVELEQRSQTLDAALQKAGVRPGKELDALLKLRTNKQERLTNLKLTVERWKAAQKYHEGSLDNAKRLSTTLSEMAKLTESAGDLWGAYYESLEARAQYDCSGHRAPETTALGTKRPPL